MTFVPCTVFPLLGRQLRASGIGSQRLGTPVVPESSSSKLDGKPTRIPISCLACTTSLGVECPVPPMQAGTLQRHLFVPGALSLVGPPP